VHDVVSSIPSAFTDYPPTVRTFTTPGGKKVCHSKWEFIPADAWTPARFEHTTCQDRRTSWIKYRIKDLDVCHEELVKKQCERHVDQGECIRNKKFLAEEELDCDYLFHRLKTRSMNGKKFVVKPSFNGNSEMSFLKVMADQSRDTLKMSEWYEDVTLKAEEFNTARLLQQQEYVSDKHFSAEMVLGQTLYNSNAEASYSIKEVYQMVTDTLRAYATFHCAGFLHGDSHDRNILVVNKTEVKLIDFDLVARLNNTTTGEKNTNWHTEKGKITNHINLILGFIPRAGSGPAWEGKTELFREMLQKDGDDTATTSTTASATTTATSATTATTHEGEVEVEVEGEGALFPKGTPNSPEDIPYCKNTKLLTVEGLFHFYEGENFEDDEAWPDVGGGPVEETDREWGAWYVNQTHWVFPPY